MLLNVDDAIAKRSLFVLVKMYLRTSYNSNCLMTADSLMTLEMTKLCHFLSNYDHVMFVYFVAWWTVPSAAIVCIVFLLITIDDICTVFAF